jgi:hypothetical protein
VPSGFSKPQLAQRMLLLYSSLVPRARKRLFLYFRQRASAAASLIA